MGTARTLEAEWVEVLRGSVGTGENKDESSTGRIWASGFHHVMALFSMCTRFEIYETFISLIFKIFFFGLR
jgi:hypothetical protein